MKKVMRQSIPIPITSVFLKSAYNQLKESTTSLKNCPSSNPWNVKFFKSTELACLVYTVLSVHQQLSNYLLRK